MTQRRRINTHTHFHKKRYLIRSAFYRHFLIAFLFLLTCILTGLLLFWFWLADFQKCLPQQQTDRVVSAFRSADTGSIIAWCHTLPTVLQNPKNLHAYMNGHYDSAKVYCYEDSISSSDNDTRRYILSDGSTELAVLTLIKETQSSFWNHHAYRISSLKLMPLCTYTITAPSSVVVLLNGQPLSAGYLSSSDPLTDVFASAGLSDSAISTYTIRDLNYISSLSAEGCSVSTPAADTYRIFPALSESEKNGIDTFAESFTKCYTVFATQKNASPKEILSMVFPDSSLYRTLSAYNTDWGQTYLSDQYDALSVSDEQKYGDHAFSCFVSVNYRITGTLTNGEKSYVSHYLLYLTDISGQYQVLAMKVTDK